jgi:hypothetical protein
LTSQPQRAGFPLTLELKSPKLKKSSWLKISQIRTLSVERIGKRLGTVSAEELDLATKASTRSSAHNFHVEAGGFLNRERCPSIPAGALRDVRSCAKSDNLVR